MVVVGHGAYEGVGGYAVVLIFKCYHLPILVGLAAARFAAAAVGLITGLVAQRAVRLYFSLLTLAISQLLFSIVFSWYDFTGGDNGISITLPRSEEHTSELQSHLNLVCRLLLEKKKKNNYIW